MESEVGNIYTASHGDLVLTLEVLPEDEPWRYGVTSPQDPGLTTEANSLEEAFAIAKDALAALQESRARLAAGEECSGGGESFHHVSNTNTQLKNTVARICSPQRKTNSTG